MVHIFIPSPRSSEGKPVGALACCDHPQSNLFRVHTRVPRLKTPHWWSALILLLCCLTVGISGCGYEVNGSSAAGALLASPATINFGDVPVGQTANSKISLVNQSAAPVNISSLNVNSQTFYVSDPNSLPVTVAPGGSYAFGIGFKPGSATTYSGTFIALDSAGNPVAQGSVSGAGTDAATATATPQLTVSAASPSFGNVAVGSSSTESVTLTSSGTAPVTINSASITGAGFSVSGVSFPVTLTPKQATTLIVQFKPLATGEVSGNLTINSNSSTSPIATVALSAAGAAASTSAASTSALTINPASLSFNNVIVGSATTQLITLTSSGTAAVTINSASITGAGFSVSGGKFPVTLSPKKAITLTVQFKPASTGAVSGQLTIASNASAKATPAVSLSGIGISATSPQLTTGATSLSFGSVTMGSSSTKSVTLTSSGTAPVSITKATVIRGAGFSLSGVRFPVTLNPKQAVTLQVHFAPKKTGTATGTLAIYSDSSLEGTTVVNLSGTGAAAAKTPTLTVSTTSLSFGNVTVGTSSTKSVTLTSTGTAAVTISSATITGAGFTVSGASFPVTLSPKQTLSLTVQFKPASAAAVSGKLTITSNSSTDATAAVSLSGTGTAATTPTLTVSLASLSFGNVTVGTSSTQSVTLTSSGTAPVTISSAAISGTGFTVSGSSFPVTLSPKQTLSLTVQFKPAATGAVSGKLTITSNSSTNATATVSLSGTGIATTPQLTVSSSSLSFGNVTVGSSSTLSVTLTSSGTGPVTISSAAISGTGFTVSGSSFPVTLSPKQTLSLTVQFKPAATGTVSGKLTITSNSSTNATATVSLSGTGAAEQHEVDLTWDAPSSSPVPVAGYDVYRSTGGSAFQLLNSSLDTQTAYVDSTVQSGKTYSYEVESVDASGMASSPSNQITVTIP